MYFTWCITSAKFSNDINNLFLCLHFHYSSVSLTLTMILFSGNVCVHLTYLFLFASKSASSMLINFPFASANTKCGCCIKSITTLSRYFNFNAALFFSITASPFSSRSLEFVQYTEKLTSFSVKCTLATIYSLNAAQFSKTHPWSCTVF